MDRARSGCPRRVPGVGTSRRRPAAVPGEHAGDPGVGRRTVRVLVAWPCAAAPRSRVARGRVGRGQRIPERAGRSNARDVWRGNTSSESSTSSGRATSMSVTRSLGPRTGCAPRSNAPHRTFPADDGALFRGLVVGDDRDQPREMIDRFRASGLSHLTAVSGQNVSFLLAAAGPILRRLRPWMRWAVTIGLIAWFVALTRYEPSIVRAGAMAGLSATAFVLGRDRSPVRILAVAVTGSGPRRPAARLVGRVLAVGRCDARRERGGTVDCGATGPVRAGAGSSRCRSGSRWVHSWAS